MVRENRVALRAAPLAFAVAALVLLGACSKVQPKKDFMWVAAPQSQIFLRDRLATLYNKTATVHSGERVEVLERQKRFVRVRTAAGQEGWVEARYLVGPEVYEGFQNLASATAKLPVQAHALARNLLNMHLAASREADVLYQLKEGDRVEVFKRAVAERAQSGAPRAVPATPPKQNKKKRNAAPAVSESGALLEDWWLVRDSQGRAGWVLGRAIDLDVPLDIAQYSEGQRIVACFPLNEIQDGDKEVPQYLTLATEPHDGAPYDFDQVRVFTWSVKRHRYETGYRERLFGVLPAVVGTRDFEGLGTLPVFTIRAKDVHSGSPAGAEIERTYRLEGTAVRRVLAPGEQPPARPAAPRKPRRRHR
jgi:SH3-like domain-containing protein